MGSGICSHVRFPPFCALRGSGAGLVVMQRPILFGVRRGPLSLGPACWAQLHRFWSSASHHQPQRRPRRSHKIYFIWARRFCLSWVVVYQIPLICLEAIKRDWLGFGGAVGGPSFLSAWGMNCASLTSSGDPSVFHPIEPAWSKVWLIICW